MMNVVMDLRPEGVHVDEQYINEGRIWQAEISWQFAAQ
jgi:hypothetical protein